MTTLKTTKQYYEKLYRNVADSIGDFDFQSKGNEIFKYFETFQ